MSTVIVMLSLDNCGVVLEDEPDVFSIIVESLILSLTVDCRVVVIDGWVAVVSSPLKVVTESPSAIIVSTNDSFVML